LVSTRSDIDGTLLRLGALRAYTADRGSDRVRARSTKLRLWRLLERRVKVEKMLPPGAELKLALCIPAPARPPGTITAVRRRMDFMQAMADNR